MIRTRVVQRNRSQVVLLPNQVAFPAAIRNVIILRDGAKRVIVPADAVWDDFVAAPAIDLGAPAACHQERDLF